MKLKINNASQEGYFKLLSLSVMNFLLKTGLNKKYSVYYQTTTHKKH